MNAEAALICVALRMYIAGVIGTGSDTGLTAGATAPIYEDYTPLNDVTGPCRTGFNTGGIFAVIAAL